MTTSVRRILIAVAVATAVATTGWVALREDEPAAETARGADPGFDQLLRDAGAGRRFLFDEGNRLVLADLVGDRPDEVALDLAQATGQPASIVCSAALSPDRRRVALTFWSRQTISARRELLVLDLPSGRVIRLVVPSPPGDPADPARGAYELVSPTLPMPLPHWIDGTTLLVGLVWYPAEAPHEYRHKLLRYDVDQPDGVALLEGLPDRVWPFAAPDGVLYIRDGAPRGKERVWVPTATGLREATPAERDRCDHLDRTQYSEKPVGGPSEVTVTRRRSRVDFEFDPDSRRHDQDLRVNGRLLRRVDWPYGGSLDPVWDPGLGVYRWEERDRDVSFVVVAAPDGRFRRWHAGRYVGWVPAM